MCGLAAYSLLIQSQIFGFNYETYLESWDSLWSDAMEGMPPVPSTATKTYDGAMLDIAFASYTFPGLNGVQFSDVTGDANNVINCILKMD